MKQSTPQAFNQSRNRLRPSWKPLARQEAIIGIFVLAHLAIVLPLAAILNIWFDEAYSLHTTSQDVTSAVQQGLNYEWQPPVFPVLLNLWRSLNDSIFFARLFCILCTTSTIFVSFLLSKRLIKTIHPAWMCGIVAFNPFLIGAAVEIRLYALGILLSALLLLFFFDGYLAEESNPKARWIYFALSVLGLYTHFFIAFVLVGNGLALIGIRRWKAFRAYFVSTAIAGLCFFPFFLLLVARLSDRIEAYSDPVPLTHSLSFALLSMVNSVVYVWKEPTFFSRLLRAFWGIALPAVCIVLITRNRRAIQPQQTAIWVSTLVIGLLLAAFLTATSTETRERYAYPLLIPSILSFLTLLSLGNNAAIRKRSLRIWAGILSCSFALSLLMIYQPLAKTGDWSRVGSYLMSAEGNNQPILVFNTEVSMVLKPYYHGRNSIVPIPRAQVFDQFNTADFQIKDEQEVIDTFARLPKEQQQTVWLVTSQMHCPDIGAVKTTKYGGEQNCEILTDFLSKHYSVKSVKHFFESTVQLLEKRADRAI